MNATEHQSEYSDATNGDPRSGGQTLTNGFVGGVVAILLSILPLSTALGGGVAGYLERGQGRRGTTAGGIAGLVASIPYVLAGTFVAYSPAVALPGPELGLAPGFVVVAAVAFVIVYGVGLSILGSLLGGYLRDYRTE